MAGSTELEKGLMGKINFENFKNLTSLIKSTNEKNSIQFEADLSKNHLDFNLAGGLFPVSEMKENSGEVWKADALNLINTSKKNKLYWAIYVEKNPKYEMHVEPTSGILKAKSSVQIVFRVRIFCTTKIFQIGKIFLSLKDSKLVWPGKAITSSSRQKGVIPMEESPFVYVSFRMESELSPSLDYDEIDFIRELARGGYGSVWLARWREAEVAVKVLNNQEMVEEEKEVVQREIALMSKLNYAYIVTYMGSTRLPSQPLCIVMEYVQEGSLKKLLKKPLETSFKIKLALDVSKGLSYLHSNSICHRDIKPDNVLVLSTHKDAHVNVKLTDFGTSKTDASSKSFYFNLKLNQSTSATDKKQSKPVYIEENKPRNLTKGVGTLIYSAPEILNGSSNYDAQKSDVYSFGILLWELFLQKEPFSDPPYDKYSNTEIARFVIDRKRMEIPKELGGDLTSLISNCWCQEPESRPSFTEITKILEKLLKDVPEPLPIEIQEKVGWHGEIDREQSELLLKGCAKGTFLLRYSKNQNSFVLSYKDDLADPKKMVTHISGINQNKSDYKVVVTTTRGQITYNTLIDYINTMISSKIISAPLRKDEGIYGVTDL